jgi:MFS family permease
MSNDNTKTKGAHNDGAASNRVLWSLIGLGSLCNLAAIGSKAALPLAAIHLGASPFAVGIIMAAFALIPAVIALRLGRILDRMGPRRPMMGGALGMIAGLGIAFGFGSLPALFICSMIVGTSGSFFFMSHTQAVGKLSSPENRTAMLSMSSMGYSLSSFLGPVVAGAAIDGFSHASAFLALAIAPLIGLAVLYFRLLPISDTTPRSMVSATRGRAMDFFRTPALRRLYAAGVITQTAWDGMTLIVPIHGHSAGLSATAIGIALGTFSFGTLAVRSVLPALSRRLRPWRLLGVAFSVAAVGFAVLPFTGAVYTLMVTTFLIGLGLGVSLPIVTSQLFDAAPEGRVGEALGVRTSLANVSQSTFPLALGGLGSLFGVMPIALFMAAMMASGSWMARRA